MDRSVLMAGIAVAGAAAALMLALSAHRRISAARRSLTVLQGSYDGKTLLDAVAHYVVKAQRVEGELASLTERQRELFAKLSTSARNIGLVRYDAFEDMGGRMSFSAALLDDQGTGIVLTSINGRTEARTYAKAIRAGDSAHNLSPEEREAISGALGERAKARR
ncbi:MAG: DUF4446 family protein [Candidatus Methylomirabilales bacterium]